jgi:hypothetical protein
MWCTEDMQGFKIFVPKIPRDLKKPFQAVLAQSALLPSISVTAAPAWQNAPVQPCAPRSGRHCPQLFFNTRPLCFCLKSINLG